MWETVDVKDFNKMPLIKSKIDDRKFKIDEVNFCLIQLVIQGKRLHSHILALQNKFGGKLPNSVIWKSAEYYSIESSLLTGS